MMDGFNPYNRKREKLINVPEKMEVYRPKLEEMSGKKIDMYEFVGLEKSDGTIITRKEVEDDMKKLQSPEFFSERDERIKMFSDLVEMAWVAAVNRNLFGNRFRAVRTSEYDDAHGVDFIATKKALEKNDKESYFGFAVDVSFSAEAVRKKLEGVKLKIRQRRRRIGEPKPKYPYSHLYKIKYFKDSDGIYRELSVPRVIIGMGYSASETLIENLVYFNSDKILKEAYTRIRATLEILWQTRYFYNLAKEKGRTHTAIAYRDFYNSFIPFFEADKEFLLKHKDDILSDRSISVFIEVLGLKEDTMFNFKPIKKDNTILIPKFKKVGQDERIKRMKRIEAQQRRDNGLTNI